MRLRSLPGLSLAAALFSACLFESGESAGVAPKWGNDSLRSVQGRVYTDHEFGYTLTFPKGWTLRPNFGGWLDLDAWRKGKPEFVYAQRRGAGEASLFEEVQDRYVRLDSSVIHPPVVRGGVEVVVADLWDEVDGSPFYWRYVNFRRDGVWIEVMLATTRLGDASLAHLDLIDSSLTFF